MGRIYQITIFLFLVFFTIPSFAQDEGEKVKDFELWLAVQASKKFDKDIELALEVQSRLIDYSQTFAEIGFNYKALDFLNLGTNLRFKFLEGGTTEYRIAPFIGIEAGKKDVEMAYQFKYQATFSRFDDPKSSLRSKVSAKYKINKKWRLATSMEIFMSKKDEVFWINKFRWMLSCRHKFSKRHYLTWFYGIQRENRFEADDDIVQMHIVGTRYDIKW